jgi:hypothetical protein
MSKTKTVTRKTEVKTVPKKPMLDFDGAAKEIAVNKTPAQLAKLNNMIEEADLLDAQMDDLTKQMEAISGRYNFLKTNLLPAEMARLQQTALTSTSGTTISIESFVSGSLPKEPDARKAALNFLTRNDGEALIKTEVNVPFGKGQLKLALELSKHLKKQGYIFSMGSGVNANSLLAYARERMKKGEKIDLKVLGLMSGSVAKIVHAGKTAVTKMNKAAIKEKGKLK